MMNAMAIDVGSEVSSLCVAKAGRRVGPEKGVRTRLEDFRRVIKGSAVTVTPASSF